MNTLSIFISSNKVIFLLESSGNFKSESFSFYPFIQSKEDLEFLVISYLKTQDLGFDEVNIIPISTIHNLQIFGKKINFLTYELSKRGDFLYIYLDNLTLYSTKNISLTSLGLSVRSDNFISNRGFFSTNKFTGDIEEIVYLSKSLSDTYQTQHTKVVFGGDYFTNPEIPNEFKLNLISEILSKGFYEVYLDLKNEFPNYLNLRNNTSSSLRPVEFFKFTYLVSSEKTVELIVELNNKPKYLNIKQNETYFLHFKNEKDLKLKYKGKEIKNAETYLDTEFSGLLVDLRTAKEKKINLGVESFRKVLNSLEKENDYASL